MLDSGHHSGLCVFAAEWDRRPLANFSFMRMILIDYSRQAKALKRPTSSERVPLHEEMAWVDAASEEMLALNTALDELEAVDERKVRVIELRFFLDCMNEKPSELMDVSRARVDRDLAFAKAWLYQRRLTGLSANLRRRQPKPANPNPISSREDGSGVDEEGVCVRKTPEAEV